MASRPYRIIEHPSDTGFEVQGASRIEVFEAAAVAFFSIMWQIGVQQETAPVDLEVRGGDLEELLVNFLEEFLYFYDAKGLVCTRVQIDELGGDMIRARAWLQAFDAARDQELLGVKAVTYHQLFIGRTNNTWAARIFLDI